MIAFVRLGDVFGHRLVFTTGLVVSAIAFVLCATAPSYGWLLAARALQGVGAALVTSCGLALATTLFVESERSWVLGVYTAIFGAGMALGPALGGVLVDFHGWSAVFWFRLPLLALALVWLLPAPRLPVARGHFDLSGGLLLAIGLSAFLLALNFLHGLDRNPVLPAGLAVLATAFSRCLPCIRAVRFFRC